MSDRRPHERPARPGLPMVFALVTGVGMLGFWTFALLAGQVPEVATEPVRLGFHVAAEALTAIALVVAGVAVVRDAAWAKGAYTLAVGMLLYTVVVSPGYYAQQGAWPAVGMFALVGALGVMSLARVLRSSSA